MNNRAMIASYGEQKEKRSGNIYRDQAGNIFSYGSHYPLLFKVNSKWYVNEQGYSNTTARHISLARQFADISVKIPNGSSFSSDLSYDLKNAYKLLTGYLKDEIAGIEAEEKTTIRKKTQKYARIIIKLDNAKENLQKHLLNK